MERLWKLAGINYAVQGPYNRNEFGDGFNAAIFDLRGLYLRMTEWLAVVFGEAITGNFTRPGFRRT